MRLLRPDDSAPALVDAATGRTWTHAEAAADAAARAEALRRDRRAVAFVECAPDAASALRILGVLASGHVAVLLDAGLDPALRAELELRYRPELLLRAEDDAVVELHEPGPEPHPDLRLTLSTSGTTGSPKLVRLGLRNLEANAASIAEYLELGAAERAIATLPLHYSYGLSVFTSHLIAGGSVVFPEEGLLRPSFWETFDAQACTSLAAVPYQYAMLRRVGWQRRELPSLRTMTQAGGRLDPEIAAEVDAEMRRRGGRFFVMYGQTEATARIAYVPPGLLAAKPGAIGVPIPGGELRVDDGELVYRGPNVMLGYAETRDDLARGDDQHGELRTGDLGRRDEDGIFFVTGRLKRFTKVHGLRVSLDDIERAAGCAPVAAVGSDEEAIHVFVEHGAAVPDEVARRLADTFSLRARTFAVTAIERLPVTSNGKVDYGALAELARA